MNEMNGFSFMKKRPYPEGGLLFCAEGAARRYGADQPDIGEYADLLEQGVF